MEDIKPSLVERAAARLGRPSEAPPPLSVVPPIGADPSQLLTPLERTRTAGFRSPSRAHGETIGSWQHPTRNSPVCFDPVRLREACLIDWTATRTRALEEFRIIKRQLLQRKLNKADDRPARRNLVMITSALPREGKTFTALNLAISIAMAPDRQVLLVDACDNENSVRGFLQERPTCGWLDLMIDSTLDARDALLATDIPRLSVMLRGGRQQHDAELLGSDRMQTLLSELSDRYPDRIVLIDAPSCLESSDAATLARMVDQTILVLEANTTQQPSLEAAMELVRPCANTYLVLNKRPSFFP